MPIADFGKAQFAVHLARFAGAGLTVAALAFAAISSNAANVHHKPFRMRNLLVAPTAIGGGDVNDVSGNGSFIGAGGYTYANGGATTTGNSITGADSLTTIDEDGVALAAVKALHAENEAVRADVRALRANNAKLQSEIDALRREVAELARR